MKDLQLIGSNDSQLMIYLLYSSTYTLIDSHSQTATSIFSYENHVIDQSRSLKCNWNIQSLRVNA